MSSHNSSRSLGQDKSTSMWIIGFLKLVNLHGVDNMQSTKMFIAIEILKSHCSSLHQYSFDY